MSRRDLRNSYLHGPQSRSKAPAWVATAGFALVICTLAVMARSTPPASAPASSAAVVAQAEQPATATPTTVAAVPRRTVLPAQPASRPAFPATPAAAAQPQLGGGAQADYSSLIDLIQSETSGPWEDTTGSGGTISDTGQMAGIYVDPAGLLAQVSRRDQTGGLAALGIAAALASSNADINRTSRLRLVSLRGLEQEVARRLQAGEPLPAEIRYLAGLEQVRFLFVYPETGDIVIGGPAEGWRADERGNPVGASNGHPVLQLDDLVTVLRTFSAGSGGVIGCSIDPRPEGLKRIKELVAKSNAAGSLSATQVRPWTEDLQRALGRQDISITGVPADSRIARVLVEADYKMKLIGIGKLDAGANVPGIFELLTAQEQSDSTLDALRWWLSMKYNQVLHSETHDVFQLVGSTVLCQSENEFVNSRGERVKTGRSDGSNRRFATNFTRHYGEISRRDTVFADLKNIFDLSLVAALINQQGLADRAEWDMGVFAKGGDFAPASHPVPRTVESVVNHRVYRGRDIVVQVAGGVTANFTAALKKPDAIKKHPRLNGIAAPAARPANLPEGRWWWDVRAR